MAYIDEGWGSKHFNGTATDYKRIGSKRKFGVELEFNDLPESVYDAEGKTVFGAKEDYSVYGGEFYSPILYGDDGLVECEKLCDLADEQDWAVGNGAGYHLHCDMREESAARFKSTVLAYHYTYKFWKNTVSRNRRRNSYCPQHRFTHTDVNNIEETRGACENFAGNYDRYAWMNVASYNDHGTFELRLHEGTKAKPDVVNWIIAHTRFIDAASNMSVGQVTRVFGGNKTIADMFREIRVMLAAPETSDHLAKRYRRHTGRNAA